MAEERGSGSRAHEKQVLEGALALLGNRLVSTLEQQVMGGWVLDRKLNAVRRLLRMEREAAFSSPLLEDAFLATLRAFEDMLAHFDTDWRRSINPRSIIAYQPPPSGKDEALRLLRACEESLDRLLAQAGESDHASLPGETTT